MSSAPTGPAAAAAPRLCCLEKGPDGYGFHLHGEKGKPGQFIRLVEAGSPAERSGLLAGDRLLEVDGANVERESHQQVVERIRAAAGSVRLLVVQPQQPEEPPHKKSVALVTAAATAARPPAAPDGFSTGSRKNPVAGGRELRPRLCHIKKGPNGYGFNLHSDKSRPGQYIRSGAVNGVSVEGKQHASVVAAIKEGGDDTKLLVVDVLTDEFFKKCKVVPSEAHLAGPLPEPVANGDIEKVRVVFMYLIFKLKPSSFTKLWARFRSPSILCPWVGDAPRDCWCPPGTGSPRSSASGSLLDLDIPLAVAKERAHQKRTSKRAPQMDWSKKNELFSNL
uniref:Na(+)/H(+) exchange regulatory cofactor NHE-RF n=1 Tax=Anas platyrhynchos TaxID=8839 RepID=A0A8B9SWG5_ANAPL